jgi:hypothetical protein
MNWELLATWLALGITVAGGVFFMGKQSQKIEDLQEQCDELHVSVKEVNQLPIKMASLETSLQYLVQSITEIKTMLLKDLAGGK